MDFTTLASPEVVEKTIANGKHILEMQSDKTVNAIKKAIAGG